MSMSVAKTAVADQYQAAFAEHGDSPAAVLSPEQVRDAYRSGFVGTGYTVSLPIEQSKLIRPGTLIVRASLADALSGRTFSVTRTVDVRGAAGK